MIIPTNTLFTHTHALYSKEWVEYLQRRQLLSLFGVKDEGVQRTKMTLFFIKILPLITVDLPYLLRRVEENKRSMYLIHRGLKAFTHLEVT